MFVAAFMILLPLLPLAFWSGARLPSASPRRKVLVLLVCSVLILLRLSFTFVPTFEYYLGLPQAYGFFEPWWAIVPFSCILGYGAATIPPNRRTLYIGVGSLFYVWFVWSHWLLFTTDYSTIDGKPDEHGFCYQSTAYTCGPAASVTALHLLGLHATEAEISAISRPTQYTGANEFLLAYSLNKYLGRKNAPHTARLFVLDAEDLAEFDTFPILATRGFSPLIDHWIVLCARDKEGIRVFDPISGPSVRSDKELRASLNPVCIKFDPS